MSGFCGAGGGDEGVVFMFIVISHCLLLSPDTSPAVLLSPHSLLTLGFPTDNFPIQIYLNEVSVQKNKNKTKTKKQK